MKPRSAAFLAKSREFLAKVQDLLDAHHWPDEAGRAAYLAGLHATQALIFESTSKAIKRHSGVQREFARLVKDDPRFEMDLRAFIPPPTTLKLAPTMKPALARKRLPNAPARRSRWHAGL